MKTIGRLVGIALVAAAFGAVLLGATTARDAYDDRPDWKVSRLQHGCELMAAVSRTRADTLRTIEKCTEWLVPNPMRVRVGAARRP